MVRCVSLNDRVAPRMADSTVTKDAGVEPATHRFLRDWRKLSGLTQQEVAERIGVVHSTVQKWETGEVPVSLRRLETLAPLYQAWHPGLLLLSAPRDAEQLGRLRSMWQTLRDMEPADVDLLLALARRLARTTAA